MYNLDAHGSYLFLQTRSCNNRPLLPPIGVGVMVGVGVCVGVGVGVGVAVGVEVGVNVTVGVGVNVGPNTWPGPQAVVMRIMNTEREVKKVFM